MSKQNIKISVICPTIRPRGLEIIQECLAKQTFQEFEFLVEVGIPERGHDLNAAFNRMIRRAKGELLVFWQDYVKAPDDALEKWWKAYQKHQDTLMTAPLGKVDNYGDKEIRWDWRAWKQNEKQTDFTDCLPRSFEIDWGAAPKKAIYDIGGFDEEADFHWSGDNVLVAIRADMKGWKFACFFTNPAIVWDHDAHMKHPFRERYNTNFLNDRINAYKAGLEVDYLSTT